MRKIQFHLHCAGTLLSTFDNEETYQFHTSSIDRIPLQPILPSSNNKQHNVSNMSTQLATVSKKPLRANASSITKHSRKRLRTSSVEEIQQYITNTLDNQNESLQVYYNLPICIQ